jgi:hypothetical protein
MGAMRIKMAGDYRLLQLITDAVTRIDGVGKAEVLPIVGVSAVRPDHAMIEIEVVYCPAPGEPEHDHAACEDALTDHAQQVSRAAPGVRVW